MAELGRRWGVVGGLKVKVALAHCRFVSVAYLWRTRERRQGWTRLGRILIVSLWKVGQHTQTHTAHTQAIGEIERQRRHELILLCRQLLNPQVRDL